jgi:hypothetical protein
MNESQELCLIIEGSYDAVAPFAALGIIGVPTNHVAPNAVVIRVHRGHANQSCLNRRFEGQQRAGWR